MMTPTEVFKSVSQKWSEAKELCDEANEMLVGKSVRILSDYNGQPFGSSKPSLRGKVFRVRGVHFDMHWGVSLQIEGQRIFVRLDEVEPEFESER